VHAGRSGPTTPTTATPHRLIAQHGFRLFPFRSPLLRESHSISFPSGTEMVQFPEYHLRALFLFMRRMTESQLRRVTPFGNLRICGCVPLPVAFRSLPRPSSSDSSKASTMDPYSLDHITSYSLPYFPIGPRSTHGPTGPCQRPSRIRFFFRKIWKKKQGVIDMTHSYPSTGPD
jgi:hypothetical protein